MSIREAVTDIAGQLTAGGLTTTGDPTKARAGGAVLFPTRVEYTSLSAAAFHLSLDLFIIGNNRDSTLSVLDTLQAGLEGVQDGQSGVPVVADDEQVQGEVERGGGEAGVLHSRGEQDGPAGACLRGVAGGGEAAGGELAGDVGDRFADAHETFAFRKLSIRRSREMSES